MSISKFRTRNSESFAATLPLCHPATLLPSKHPPLYSARPDGRGSISVGHVQRTRQRLEESLRLVMVVAPVVNACVQIHVRVDGKQLEQVKDQVRAKLPGPAVY